MNSALVTGGSGFIGQHLISLLSSEGFELKLLTRTPIDGFVNIKCDLQNNIPKDALKGVDTIFHLAGFTHDRGNDVLNQKLYYAVNVKATVQLAELAVKLGVSKFIFVSSVKAGGSSLNGECLDEESIHEPEGIYGKTKREAELKLIEIGRRSGMQISIIRPSLVYGPDVKGNLKMLISGIRKGWFPPLPELGNRRSMIHVDDLVRSLLFVSKSDHVNGEIFIATDSVNYSSRDIYETICYLYGISIPKWGVPKIIFDSFNFLGKDYKYRVRKLLGSDCYSSKKLHDMGFVNEKSFKNMNQTNY